MTPETSSWVDPETGELISIPTADIVSVQFASRARGTRQGLGIGLATGVVVGGALGYLAYTPCETSCLFTRSELAVYWAGIGALAGAGTGALVGRGTASRETYRFAPFTPAAP